MKPFQAVSLLSGLAPSSSGDSPRSAVNICRPCCGEAFELPVKAVALGINEEDTINTLILYSNIVSLYIYNIYISISVGNRRRGLKTNSNIGQNFTRYNACEDAGGLAMFCTSDEFCLPVEGCSQ